jgi:hypothetical protein
MTPDELQECINAHPEEYLEFMKEFEKKLHQSRELYRVCYICNFPMLKDYCINCKIMEMEK